MTMQIRNFHALTNIEILIISYAGANVHVDSFTDRGDSSFIRVQYPSPLCLSLTHYHPHYACHLLIAPLCWKSLLYTLDLENAVPG